MEISYFTYFKEQDEGLAHFKIDAIKGRFEFKAVKGEYDTKYFEDPTVGVIWDKVGISIDSNKGIFTVAVRPIKG